ncbi:hypothetical protein PCANB_003106 [Pneumocystis canis]|nr:hypothetical protein PCANB_003106 [Pneumocystis canis]
METIFDPLCSPSTEFVNPSSFLDDFDSEYIFTQYTSDNSDHIQSKDIEKFLDINFNEYEYNNKEMDEKVFRDTNLLNCPDIHFEADDPILKLSTLYDIPWIKSIFDTNLTQKGDIFGEETSSNIYVDFNSPISSSYQKSNVSLKNSNEKTNTTVKELLENDNSDSSGNISHNQEKNSTLSCLSDLVNTSFFEPSFASSLTPQLSPLVKHKLNNSLPLDPELPIENSLKQVNTSLNDIFSKQLFINNDLDELSQSNLYDYNTNMQYVNNIFLENNYISNDSVFKKRSFQDLSDDDTYLSPISLKKNRSMCPIKNNIYDYAFNQIIQDNSAMLLSQPYVSPKSTLIFDNDNLSFINYEQAVNENQEYINPSSSIPFEIYLPSTIASWSSPKYNDSASMTSIKGNSSKNIGLKNITYSSTKFKKTPKYPISSRSFINFTERDAEIILNGVAPSGSSKKH